MDKSRGAITASRCKCDIFFLLLYFLILDLQAFHNISLEMQTAGIPLISSVIPRIDDLVQVIDEFKDAMIHLAVRGAAIQGLKLLNKYYDKSDESLVYQILMGKSHSVYASRRCYLFKWQTGKAGIEPGAH